jgi:hypothetical protein
MRPFRPIGEPGTAQDLSSFFASFQGQLKTRPLTDFVLSGWLTISLCFVHPFSNYLLVINHLEANQYRDGECYHERTFSLKRIALIYRPTSFSGPTINAGWVFWLRKR